MGKSVFTKEEADNLVVAYQPKRFPIVASPSAVQFMQFQSDAKAQGDNPSFKIDKIVAQHTGMAEIERLSMEERVEIEALKRLKELQEQAYQQAYQLGLDEGREKAFVEHQNEINEKLDGLEAVLRSLETLKVDLISSNEGQIVNLIYSMAKQIAMDEISERNEVILSVVKQTLEGAQSEESITVKLSTRDHAFIEGFREKLGKEFETLKRSRLEAVETILDGGCVVVTNYGEVDATIEQRVNKLWEALVGKVPKVKSVVGEE